MESSYQREVIKKKALIEALKKQRDNGETERKNRIFLLNEDSREGTESCNNICKITGTVFHEWILNINGTHKIKKLH